MITAIDTNILIDVFLPDPVFGAGSLKALEEAFTKGALVVCNIVYAELVPQFREKTLLDSTLKKLNIDVVPVSNEAWFAGENWLEFRKQKRGRTRIITDFLIGAFAYVQADQFLRQGILRAVQGFEIDESLNPGNQLIKRFSRNVRYAASSASSGIPAP